MYELVEAVIMALDRQTKALVALNETLGRIELLLRGVRLDDGTIQRPGDGEV